MTARKLTVLSVAYPLACVRPETAGGAEQALAMLDEALARAGHRSLVVACEGSRVAGELIATPHIDGALNASAERRARENHRRAILQTIEREPVDLVHMHGQDFHHYLPPPGVPVLVTLHVPREWYAPEAFPTGRPRTYFHCVSKSQRLTWPADFPLLDEIENGVDIDRFKPRVSKRGFALALGRIAPEKGFHLALDAAAAAGVSLLVAGEAYRYAAHENYYRDEFLPRLTRSNGRFLGPVGLGRKRRLLAAARCLLAPSLVPETSSLAAMEALASGTPVVARPSGALADIVEHGRTGFLAHTVAEMAAAILRADSLDPSECRRAARERFPAGRTIRRYLEVYERLSGEPAFTGAAMV